MVEVETGPGFSGHLDNQTVIILRRLALAKLAIGHYTYLNLVDVLLGHSVDSYLDTRTWAT